MKKLIFLSILICCCLIFSTEVSAHVLYMGQVAAMQESASARLVIDNQELRGLPAPPIMRNNSVLVPARAVFEHMGGIVGWHSGNRQVTIRHGDNVMVMTIDQTTATLNGSIITLATPPIIVNNSTMIPLRPAELFGFDVNWDSATRSAIINSPEPTEILPPLPDFPPIEIPSDPGDGQGQNDNGNDNNTDDSDPNSDWYTPVHDIDTPELVPTIPGDTSLARNISTSPLTAVAHPQTSITQVLAPNVTGTGAYVVVANSPMSSINYFVLPDNRLVLDISNAVNTVTGDIPLHSSVPLSAARIAQFSTTPLVTRVVFHVTHAAEFSLALSDDRTRLTVSFVTNTITDVRLESNGGFDTLSIHGDVLPNVRISTAGYPHFMTVYIDNAQLQEGMFTGSNVLANGNFATHFTTGQVSSGTAFIRLYIGNTWPVFNVNSAGEAALLTLHSNMNGIRYNSTTRELHIAKSTGFTMDINQLVHVDNYLQLNYSIILPNAAAMLGRGELSILDGLINSVSLTQDVSGNARLTFCTTRVVSFTVHETHDAYIIRAQLPHELHPFVVIIDPGHGGRNIGSSHNGVVERELALTLGKKVMQLIDNNPNIHGFMTRWDDSTVYNYRRAVFANELNADLYISIHANAAVHSHTPLVINPDAHGIETWYNHGAREMANNNSFTSRQFAEIIQRQMLARTGANDRGLRYGQNLIVLRESNMPSVLIEVGFLTNPAEAVRLANAQHQWQLAYAIYYSIVEASNRFSG